MAKDFTQGKVARLLINFTIPLVFGNLFQLTYNAADSIIVGRFVGKEALAAVGVCNPMMTLIILFLNGLCMGAGILMGTLYGAGEIEKLHKQISTTMIAGVIFSLAITLLCIPFSTQILRVLQADEEIIGIASSYLRIIFLGVVFTFLYNFFSSTLRALGDSKSSLYFLIASSIINIIGDLFFVVVLGLGSDGCAASTVISEALCCIFCIVYIHKKVPVLSLGKKWKVFDKSLLGNTIKYGWVSAMQQATVQLGKIGVQVIVNTMDVAATAAFTAVNRVDDFTYTPEQNIGHAMTAFIAQNRGAGKKDRIRSGFSTGIMIEICYSLVVFAVCFLFAEPIMKMFIDDPEVIANGVKYLHIISFMYVQPALTNGIQGFFRGMGDLKVTLISSTVNMGVRVLVAALLVFKFKYGIEALPYSYMAGWVAMLIVETPLLFKVNR